MSARQLSLLALAGLVALLAAGPVLAVVTLPRRGASGGVLAAAVLLAWGGLFLLAVAFLAGLRRMQQRLDRIERTLEDAGAQLARLAEATPAGDDQDDRDAEVARVVAAGVEPVVTAALEQQRAALQAGVDDRVLGLHELVRELRGAERSPLAGDGDGA